MNDQVIRFRLGVFVLAVLLLFAVLVTLFGGVPSYFKKSKAFTVVFPTANGLTPGSPVRKSGVKIGEVRVVQLDETTGQVNVGIEIDDKYNLFKSDSPTMIQMLLGGDAFIAFVQPEDLKKLNLTPIEAGSTLIGKLPTDPGALLQKTDDLLKPALEALVEIKKVFQRIDNEALRDISKVAKTIDNMMPVVEGTVKDFGEVARATRDMVPELRKTNEQVQKLAKSANEAMPTVKRTAEEMELAVANWGRVGERVDLFLKTNEDKMVKTLEGVQDTVKRTAQLLGDDNQRMFREILKDVKSGSARLESLTRNADELIQETRITVRTANKTMGKLDDVMTQVGKVTGPFAERSPAILKNIEEGTLQFNKTMGDVRELIQAVGRSEGTFTKFLTDPALYNNLNDTALMVTRIMPRLDRAMRDFETFADKLARHPELLGVGGAIRPSSGLKESPSFWPPR